MFTQDSQEKIVYAGFDHVEHYVEFFEDYLHMNNKIAIVPTLDNRCVYSNLLSKYIDIDKYIQYNTVK